VVDPCGASYPGQEPCPRGRGKAKAFDKITAIHEILLLERVVLKNERESRNSEEPMKRPEFFQSIRVRMSINLFQEDQIEWILSGYQLKMAAIIKFKWNFRIEIAYEVRDLSRQKRNRESKACRSVSVRSRESWYVKL